MTVLLAQVLFLWFDYGGTLTCPATPVDDDGNRPVEPAAAATVRTLYDRGYALGLSSNTLPARPRKPALAAAGIDYCFTVCVESHRLGYAKPDPRFYVALLAAVRVPAGRMLHVGDRYDKDVLGPVKAGMQAVLVDQARHAGDIVLPPAAIRIPHVETPLERLPGSTS